MSQENYAGNDPYAPYEDSSGYVDLGSAGFDNENDIAWRDWQNAIDQGDTSDYGWVFENAPADVDFWANDPEFQFERDWYLQQQGGLSDADHELDFDRASQEVPAMVKEGMYRSGGQSPGVSALINAYNKLKNSGASKSVLQSVGEALIGANAIRDAIRNKPGSFERATGASGFSAKELPQSAIRRAAAGGLMSFATGGGVDDWKPGTEYDKSKLPVYFDWQKYVAANPDLGQAGIDTQTEAERHYMLDGRSEGRTLGMTGYEISDAVSRNWQQAQQNTAAAATGKTDLAKQLWEQYGQNPEQLRKAALSAGITGGDLAAATGYDPKIMSSYMQQWLNPAITRYSSIDDMVKSATAARNDTSGFVVGPANAPTMKDYYDKNPSASPFTEGWLAPTKPATPATPPVASQPYPFQPGDIYNRNPVYADIKAPGVNPLVRSESPMPLGAQPYTTPYEAIRYSSRLLQEGMRPGAAWNRGGGQVEYIQKAAGGGLMGLQEQTNLGRYAGGGLGRLVQGPGDGVSDSVPAMIGGQQPALIAQGEYVLPARVVSELGNGSTEAGAQRIDQMVAKIEQMGKSAGRGKDSGAHKLLG